MDGAHAFEAAVAAALLDPADAGEEALEPARGLIADPAFAVYRNTVLSALIDALESNFPAVATLVGTEWFRAAAAIHARAEPPRHPALVHYGAGFPAFLSDFPPAADLPYLAPVAALDRLWTEAHVAADAPILGPEVLAGADPAALARMVLEPHPAARFPWFAHSAPSIWLDARGFETAPGGIAFVAGGEGVLLTRPEGAVRAARLGPGAHAFLCACAGHEPLGTAAAAALTAEPGLDLADIINRLIGAGAFASLRDPGHSTEGPRA